MQCALVLQQVREEMPPLPFVSVWPLASWSLPVLFLVSLCLSACSLCRHLPVGVCGYVLVHGPPNGLAGKFLEPTLQGKLLHGTTFGRDFLSARTEMLFLV